MLSSLTDLTERREVLTMSSGKLVPPSVRTTIKGETKVPFRAERLVLSHAGTSGGTADWVVNEIRQDGKGITSGDVRGDLFATDAANSVVTWGECSKDMEFDVTYVGANPDGCPFFGAIVGSAATPPAPSKI